VHVCVCMYTCLGTRACVNKCTAIYTDEFHTCLYVFKCTCMNVHGTLTTSPKKKKVVNDVATRASRRASESARSPQRVSLNAVFGGMYKHTATRCNILQHTAAN